MTLDVLLRDLVIIFALAVVVVALLQRVQVPSIAGFIIAGMLFGPHALGLIRSAEHVAVLAEIGVVLLLFGIGLELSLKRLRLLWKPIVIGGALQMGVTVLAAWGLAVGVGMPAAKALALGCLVAVSSTAIVLRGLSMRGEIDAPQGRFALGVLVFQDLAVVPILFLLPLLAGRDTSGQHLAMTLGKAGAVVAGTLVAARYVVPALLKLIARTRQRDLFVLTVFALCLGIAYLIEHSGISLALGAFLAGITVAGSDFRHQALAEIVPLREVLASVFFVSIGMLLSPRALGSNIGLVLGLLLALVLGKALIMLFVGWAMRFPLRISVLTALTLAQGGEFFFVLGKSADDLGLLPGVTGGALAAAVVLSMVVTPFVLKVGPKVAAGAEQLRFIRRLLDVKFSCEVCEAEPALADHVVLAGAGITGMTIAAPLKELGVRYLMIDLNAENVRAATAAGHPAYLGDAANAEVLEQVAIERATDFVIAVNDPNAERRAVRTARHLSPGLHILARTRYIADVPTLRADGADEVVVAELETAVQLLERVCTRHGVDRAAVSELIDQLRVESCGVLTEAS